MDPGRCQASSRYCQKRKGLSHTASSLTLWKRTGHTDTQEAKLKNIIHTETAFGSFNFFPKGTFFNFVFLKKNHLYSFHGYVCRFLQVLFLQCVISCTHWLHPKVLSVTPVCEELTSKDTIIISIDRDRKGNFLVHGPSSWNRFHREVKELGMKCQTNLGV